MVDREILDAKMIHLFSVRWRLENFKSGMFRPTPPLSKKCRLKIEGDIPKRSSVF